MKVGTDGVLLGAAMTILPTDRSLLDIGTGTGTIALMAAQRTQDARIEAIDIDAPSAEEAAANFARSPWGARLTARHTALQDYHPEGTFDLIFSNPPYYDGSLVNPDIRKSTARHSLSLSWRDVLDFARMHLAEQGRVALILPAACERELLREAASRGLPAQRILRIRTVPAKSVSRILVESVRSDRASLREEQLTIQEEGRYTEPYISLTSPYYQTINLTSSD